VKLTLLASAHTTQEFESMRIRALLALFIASAAAEAHAQSTCPLNYKIFEFAVPHLDLEKCPKDLTKAGTFCRVSTANDAVHVFVFEEKGDQCLVAVKSYSEYQINVK
jgi:hypothetical protein